MSLGGSVGTQEQLYSPHRGQAPATLYSNVWLRTRYAFQGFFLAWFSRCTNLSRLSSRLSTTSSTTAFSLTRASVYGCAMHCYVGWLL